MLSTVLAVKGDSPKKSCVLSRAASSSFARKSYSMIMSNSAADPACPSQPAVPEAAALRAAVRRFIGSRVSDSATADDLAQEVLIKVLKSLPQARDPRRLMGWVIQIARNTVADFYRKAKPTEEFDEQRFASPLAPGQTIGEEEESLLREELQAYIRSVVQELPPKYREALVLTLYDGLSQVELARRLGLSVSAAKSRVQRARAMVQGTIERCCDFDFDRYGEVVDWTPKPNRCGCSGAK